MFDIQEFNRNAFSGENANIEKFTEYVKSFKNIILWGAGNLGTAVGKQFIKLELPVTVYWDINFEKIKERNGIQVIQSFTGNYSPDETLVVFCISNAASSPALFKFLKDWKQTKILTQIL